MNDIINDGTDIKMKNLTGCADAAEWTLSDCEKNCKKYYSCYSVALANDILKEYEEGSI